MPARRWPTLIGAEAAEIVFTAGGTEADNFALRGVAEAQEARKRRRIVASAIEHEAVLNTCRHLGRRGYDVHDSSRRRHKAS